MTLVEVAATHIEAYWFGGVGDMIMEFSGEGICEGCNMVNTCEVWSLLLTCSSNTLHISAGQLTQHWHAKCNLFCSIPNHVRS